MKHNWDRQQLVENEKRQSFENQKRMLKNFLDLQVQEKKALNGMERIKREKDLNVRNMWSFTLRNRLSNKILINTSKLPKIKRRKISI